MMCVGPLRGQKAADKPALNTPGIPTGRHAVPKEGEISALHALLPPVPDPFATLGARIPTQTRVGVGDLKIPRRA
jgi:hypothetical protein